MPSFDFEKIPAYARARLKMARWGPQKRGQFSTAALDENFADQQMRRELGEMAFNTWKMGLEGRLSLRERGLGLSKTRLGLQAKAGHYERGQRPLANLMGVGQLLTSAATGYARIKEGQQTRRLLESIPGRFGV